MRTNSSKSYLRALEKPLSSPLTLNPHLIRTLRDTSNYSLMDMGRHPNMLGLISLQTAKKVIARIEVMHIIKKGQTLQDEKFVQNHDLFDSTI
ncbi:hypothetical protein [Bacillus cereus]|uniref:hypothetical protein n=1 Tax=Bacillus cereus TaxID=1396 RepID=UPI0039B6F24E